MLGRINSVMAAGEHRDSAARNACAMRGGVDAARKPGDDGETSFGQFAGQLLGKPDPSGGSIARANDSDLRPLHYRELPAHRQKRWWIIDHLQPHRVARFTKRGEFDAARPRGLQFSKGVLG
jgi:hypothetical protein